jgi:cystathionine beta-lyase
MDRRSAARGSVVNPPVWRASTILYDNVADLKARGHATHDKLYYGRRGTPTVWALADALTQMEPGAEGTLLYPSGVAANSAGLLALLSPGDHLLMVDSTYEPTRAFCNGMLARMGIETTYYDPLVGAGIAELIRPETKLIFLESPGSLTFEVQDIPAIVAAARARGVLTMLDNTWATPLLFPAIAHGIDVTMMSLTKYVGGHSDAMMGSLTATKAVWPRLRQAAYQLGQAVSPDDCALMLRGLRTLHVRMQRHGEKRPRGRKLARGPVRGWPRAPSGACERSRSRDLVTRFQRHQRTVRLHAEERRRARADALHRCARAFRHRVQLGRL